MQRKTRFALVLAAAACAAAVAFAPPPASAQEPDRAKIAELQKSGLECYQKKDWACFLDASRQVAALLPGNLRALYNLACAEARSGDASGAAAHLQTILDRRLDLGMEQDDDFAAVWKSPAFEPVVRKLAALRVPVSTSTVAFRLPQKDLLTEGIAWDPGSKAFFVSSVHHRKIVRRAADGRVADFVPEGKDGIQAVLALRVDAPRHLLWACSAAVPEMIGWEKSLEGSSGLFAFDLRSGKLVRRADLPKDGKHVLNDLTVLDNGDVYATDSAGSGVYRLRASGKTLEPFVAPGVFRSPQGIALARDGKRLWIADYAYGIWSVDLATGAREPLHGPDDVPLAGVDGLLARGDSLFVTQNGIRPQRVVRLVLDAAGKEVVRGEMLELNSAELTEPTLGVVAGSDLYYVANAGWDDFDKDGKMFPMEKLHEPTILKVTLPGK